MLPSAVERKLEFMLSQVPSDAYNLYFKWFMDGLGLERGKQSEAICVDIARHIVVNMHNTDD